MQLVVVEGEERGGAEEIGADKVFFYISFLSLPLSLSLPSLSFSKKKTNDDEVTT